MQEPIKEGIHIRFYMVFHNMRQRCKNKNHPLYSFYGGRGISISKEWESYLKFEEDMYESYIDFIYDHGDTRKTIPTLDRTDNSKGYSKENCRWINIVEQQKNRRTNKRTIFVNGKTLKTLSKEFGVDYGTVIHRINRQKMSPWDAVSKPIDPRFSRKRPVQK